MSQRPDIAGPDTGPEPPFPIKLAGPVIRGFGRGSKDVSRSVQAGIPTANIPPSGLDRYPSLETGIYFGYTALQDPATTKTEIYPSVLSLGYNPFYANKTRSIEIHLLHKFPHDFYGHNLNLLMLGYIRPELDYVSKEKLIEDILFDCRVAENSLGREQWQINGPADREAGWTEWLENFGWAQNVNQEDVRRVEAETLGKKDPEKGDHVGRI